MKLKEVNNMIAIVFAIMGVLALIGAAFYDAPHQLVIAAMCFAVVLVDVYETKQNK